MIDSMIQPVVELNACGAILCTNGRIYTPVDALIAQSMSRRGVCVRMVWAKANRGCNVAASDLGEGEGRFRDLQHAKVEWAEVFGSLPDHYFLVTRV